jgi:transcriptional regulator with XRE-family HTH domain
MNDLRLGLALREARIRRRLRQCDLAAQAGVSATLVSRLEHGELDLFSLRALRRVAGKLGVSLDLMPKSAGGDLDRMVNARHAALGELVAAWIACRPGWLVAAETSFAIYGERGIVDLLAFHEATGALVVIELKTAIIDLDELIGTLDRKRRLASRIAAGRGWSARSVSTWLVVAHSRTNRRRVADHRTLLTSGLPLDGRSFASLFVHPERGPISGIAFWSNLNGVKVGHPIAAVGRVVKSRRVVGGPRPRSGLGGSAAT